MKLTVIGYWGGYPARDEASSTYVLEKDEFMLLLDLGSGGLTKLQKYYDVTDVDALLLSHYHADHVADVGVLQHALLVQSYFQEELKKVPIYGHHETDTELQALTHAYTEETADHPANVLETGPS